jgi:hypothetical protein
MSVAPHPSETESPSVFGRPESAASPVKAGIQLLVRKPRCQDVRPSGSDCAEPDAQVGERHDRQDKHHECQIIQAVHVTDTTLSHLMMDSTAAPALRPNANTARSMPPPDVETLDGFAGAHSPGGMTNLPPHQPGPEKHDRKSIAPLPSPGVCLTRLIRGTQNRYMREMLAGLTIILVVGLLYLAASTGLSIMGMKRDAVIVIVILVGGVLLWIDGDRQRHKKNDP